MIQNSDTIIPTAMERDFTAVPVLTPSRAAVRVGTGRSVINILIFLSSKMHNSYLNTTSLIVHYMSSLTCCFPILCMQDDYNNDY